MPTATHPTTLAAFLVAFLALHVSASCGISPLDTHPCGSCTANNFVEGDSTCAFCYPTGGAAPSPSPSSSSSSFSFSASPRVGASCVEVTAANMFNPVSSLNAAQHFHDALSHARLKKVWVLNPCPKRWLLERAHSLDLPRRLHSLPRSLHAPSLV